MWENGADINIELLLWNKNHPVTNTNSCCTTLNAVSNAQQEMDIGGGAEQSYIEVPVNFDIPVWIVGR